MKVYAIRNKSFDGKILWLNPDPEEHWQEELVPSCMLWHRNTMVSIILRLGVNKLSLPGWTDLAEFDITSEDPGVKFPEIKN